jgi:hypothetical protein
MKTIKLNDISLIVELTTEEVEGATGWWFSTDNSLDRYGPYATQREALEYGREITRREIARHTEVLEEIERRLQFLID